MYKIAETMADIPKTNIDSLKANMYVMVTYNSLKLTILR